MAIKEQERALIMRGSRNGKRMDRPQTIAGDQVLIDAFSPAMFPARSLTVRVTTYVSPEPCLILNVSVPEQRIRPRRPSRRPPASRCRFGRRSVLLRGHRQGGRRSTLPRGRRAGSVCSYPRRAGSRSPVHQARQRPLRTIASRPCRCRRRSKPAPGTRTPSHYQGRQPRTGVQCRNQRVR